LHKNDEFGAAKMVKLKVLLQLRPKNQNNNNIGEWNDKKVINRTYNRQINKRNHQYFVDKNQKSVI